MTFPALKLANRIVSNLDDWHWDNCKVSPDHLKPLPLASVIAQFLPVLPERKIIESWRRAAVAAHSAAVDRLAMNPVPYAVACFKHELASRSTRRPQE